MVTPSGTSLERHFQTAIQGIIILILMWYGNKTIDTSDTVIRLEEQMKAIRISLALATTDRFRGVDAAAMNSLINYKFDSFEKRIKHLENE